MLHPRYSEDSTKWKRINMRRVEHLPAVELIHDLYNQYDFKINAIRFRNTVTVWRDGVVNSYAPVREWEIIASLLGDKFYNLDDLLITELLNLYNSNRTFATSYLESISLDTLESKTNPQLRDIFLNIQNFTLGDLYRLNFVQVEHALTSALYKVLDELSIPRHELASLIITDELTEFQKEEIAFANMVQQLAEKETEAEHAIQSHWQNFAYMHSAYGEPPYTVEHYREKLINFDTKQVFNTENEIRAAAKASATKVESINSVKLTTLTNLMKRGGVFRDNNKARLGQTMKYKFALLNEIAKKTNVDREWLRFYSVLEICDLLDTAKEVDKGVLLERKEHGMILKRNEYYGSNDTSHNTFISSSNILESSDDSAPAEQITLEGLGASSGRVTGVARIVFSYEDGHKVNEGDIMIAIGTDFDLMDAIQRAGAVVTEEGGFLSHASVVCRELKKPCCIGVENATRLIKDGDEVEVNAQSGVLIITKK